MFGLMLPLPFTMFTFELVLVCPFCYTFAAEHLFVVIILLQVC